MAVQDGRTRRSAEHAQEHVDAVDADGNGEWLWRGLTTRSDDNKQENDGGWKNTNEEENETTDDERTTTGMGSVHIDVDVDAAASAMELRVLLDGEDAVNVEDLCDLFEGLEEDEQAQGGSSPTESADSVVGSDDDATEKEKDVLDAEAVDEVATLFEALEKSFVEEDRDWLAALDVDDMATTFIELVDAEEWTSAATTSSADSSSEADSETESVVAQPCSTKLHVPVPAFTVRMEGAPTRLNPRSLASGAFLAGPPLLGAGTLKRKTASVTRVPDPLLSQTRRECAAKRRRRHGRFMTEKTAFVAITALQDGASLPS